MQRRDSRERQDPEPSQPATELDNQYSKIGISAVAAAVRHKAGPQPQQRDTRRIPYARD
jgi:hypothetical protein